LGGDHEQDSMFIVYNEPATGDPMSERISETQFQQEAEQAILNLERAFGDLAEERDLDVEVQGGVLSVSFEEDEPGKFIVSPNSAVRQLWVSARMTSFKLDWSYEENAFVLAGTSEVLKQLMTRLTREQLRDDAVEL
jgi:iron-sulfur cluster assembly protein CyaY